MTEAKKRNPDIKLYGLPWAFPAWVGNGTGNPYAFPALTADYVVKWVDGAQQVYGLDIDYVVRVVLAVFCVEVTVCRASGTSARTTSHTSRRCAVLSTALATQAHR
jgi:hypothetical protein